MQAGGPGSVSRGATGQDIEMRTLLRLILHGSQICPHVLRRRKELERAGDCAGVAEGPQARTLCLASRLHCSSAYPSTLCVP